MIYIGLGELVQYLDNLELPKEIQYDVYLKNCNKPDYTSHSIFEYELGICNANSRKRVNHTLIGENAEVSELTLYNLLSNFVKLPENELI